MNQLICFAVAQGAAPFARLARGMSGCKVLLSGMGQRNAEKAIRAALAAENPQRVLSCGFAGGLDLGLASGTVVFAAEQEAGLESALLEAGARPAKFHCAERVAATAAEKRSLRDSTGADAVEMESQVICAVCREHDVPAATVRVILDGASEDLPLDFNQLMNTDQQMSYGKLALALAKAPWKISALLKLQKDSATAADALAAVLARVLKV